MQIIETIRARLDKKGCVRGGVFRKKLDGLMVIREIELLAKENADLHLDRQQMTTAGSKIFEELQKLRKDKSDLIAQLKMMDQKTRKIKNKLTGKVQRKGG